MRKSVMLSLALCCLIVGCRPNQREPGVVKLTKPSRQPPPPPPRQDVPIDPLLIESARRQIKLGLESSDPLLRAHAIEAVRLTGDTASADRVVAALEDKHSVVRMAAALACGEMKIQQAHDALNRLADDPDALVQISTRFALHRLGNERLSQDLVIFARSDEARLRGHTVMVLGLLGEASALKILRPMQADRNAAVRIQAAEAMWRLGDSDGLETLVGMSVSAYPDDQMIAIPALAAPRDMRVIEHVRAPLTSDHAEVRLAAARACGMLGSDAGYMIALRHADSEDARRRLLAAFALGAIGRSDAQPTLSELLNDKVQDVRLAAAAAMLQLR